MNKPAYISMLIGVAMWAGSFGSAPVDSIHFTVLPESKVTLKGRSNVNSFTCSNSQLDGTILIAYDATKSEMTNGNANLQMKIADFNCGNALMENDMQKALGASSNPQITFAASSGEIVDTLRSGYSGTYYKIEVNGELTLAGTTKPIKVLFTGRKLRDHYRLDGTKSIDMTDFGVKPPSAMFGMIKAKKTIYLQFDLYLVAQ